MASFGAGARIRETSTTTGTGTYTLLGAPTGFQAFSTRGANNTCPYFATDGTDWEEGIGTVLTGPNRLERTTVLESSNADAAVDWGVGTRTLRCGPISQLDWPRILSKDVGGGAGTTVLTANEQRRAFMFFSGTLTGNRIVEVDATPWSWVIINGCAGAFTLTVRMTGGVGVLIPAKGTVYPYTDGYEVYCDGTDTFMLAAGQPFIDSVPHIRGSTDSTKKVRFEVDGVTTGTTRVLSIPNFDGTIATLAGTETLTGKTFNLSSNTLTGTTAQFNTALSDNDFATLAGSETLTNKTINGHNNTLTVYQGNLDTGTADISSTNASGENVTLPGGEWGFYPRVRVSGGSGAAHIGLAIANTSFVNNIHLIAPSSQTIFASQRYIQASPPYDLGNGEVPLFIFIILDSLGKIISTYAAEDPPWAGNGPTNIRVDFTDPQGRGWQRRRRKPNVAALLNPALREEELARIALPPEVIEVTQAVKKADMPLIPHPFLFNDLTGKTVVLLDPVAQVTERLRRILRGGESVAEILRGDYLALGNTPLVRAGPPGVMAVDVQWK